MKRRRRRTRFSPLALVAFLVILLVLAGQELLAPNPAPTPTAPVAISSETSSGWYEVAFTQPLFPDDKTRHHGGLDASLVALMDTATRTLDVAGYTFDLASVTEAMVRAKQRGVAVRMVTDTDTLENRRDEAVQAAFARLEQADIPVVADERSAIMHHKFTVVDGEWVQTGSWNYTYGDTYRLNNNIVIIRSRELARNYTAEFERMFLQRQFGAQKQKGAERQVIDIEGARVESYFSPQDKVAARVVDAIRQAQESIYFMTFSFTHDDIGQAIIDQAKAGRRVAGVFETVGSNTRFSEYGPLKEAGLEVYQDGNPYMMHHKVIILDERSVIFGSFNFSENADRSNDENLLIVHEPGLAQAFKAEFDRVVETAKNPPQR